MDQIIELEDIDDIHTIRDRLATATGGRVILVVPWDSPALRKSVDLQIVQRFADTTRLDVAIVSTESEVRTAAREVGLPAFRSVPAAQRATLWRKPFDEDEELAPWQPSRRKTREARRAAVERDQADAQARRRHPAWGILKVVLLMIVVVALAGTALAIIPQADIEFVPRSTQLIANVEVIADPAAETVDPLTGHVPAAEITTIVRDLITVPTTGKRGIPDTRASGPVIFVNMLNTPVTVGKGTAVRTSATGQAVRFIVTDDVQVPAGIGAQAEGRVEAVEPGAAGNVPANFINEIEGVAALAVRVSNPEPLTGGGEREVRSVDAADRETAREQIAPKLREKAIEQFQAQLGPGEFLIPESLSGTIVEATFDREVTEQADTLTLLMRVEYSVFKIASEDANGLAFAALANQAPAGYDLIPQGLGFQRGAASPVPNTENLYQFPVQGIGYAAAALDINRATRQVAGKPVDEAVALLKQALPLKSDPKIRIYPDWFPVLPWLSFRIKSEVNPAG